MSRISSLKRCADVSLSVDTDGALSSEQSESVVLSDSDGGTEDSENITPPLSKTSRFFKPGLICGRLEKLVLKNFMNHKHLEVPFGDKINFITGKNGSGKSAIVTALLIGLGARATTTQRGSSVKGLIRKGQSFALVTIHLSNVGTNPYQPDVFGPTVIIEKRITPSVASYKVKTSRDKIIGTTAKALHRVLEHFDICIDNPTTILTQDMSREFLATADAGKMYSFFKQATRLGIIEQDLEIMKCNMAEAHGNVQRKRSNIAHFLEDIKNLQSRIKVCESQEEMVVKRHKLKMECIMIDKKEVEVRKFEVERQIRVKETKITSRKAEVHSCEQELLSLREEEEKVMSDIADLPKRVEKLSEEKRELDSVIRETTNESHKLSSQIQSEMNNVQTIKREILAMEQKVEQVRHENGGDAIARRQNLKDELKEVEKFWTENKNKSIANETFLRQANETDHRLNSEFGRLRQAQAKFDSDVKQMQLRKAQLIASKSDALKAFGSHVPNVLASIDKHESQFSVKPRGPLGRYIKAVDKKYELPIELCLGKGLMTAFLCNNRQDVTILRNIFDSVIGKNNKMYYPQIITQQFVFDVYDTKKFQAVTELPTLLDVISCDDPVVLNCIIDQASPENIVVFDTLKQARETLILKNPPIRTSKGICLDGSEVVPRRAVYPSNITECRFFQRDDVPLRIASMDEKIAQCMADRKTNSQLLRDIETQLNANRKNHMSLINEKSDLNDVNKHLENEKKRLCKELSEVVDDARIEVYEEEIGRDKERVKTEEESIDLLNNELSQLKQKISALHSERANKTKEIEVATWELRSKETELRKVIGKKTEKKELVKFYGNRVEQLEKEVLNEKAACDQFDSQIELLDQKLATFGDVTADEFSRIMRSRRSKSDVLKLLNDLEVALAEKHKQVPEKKEDLEARLALKQKDYNKITEEIDQTEDLLKLLEEAIVAREKRFILLRDTSAATMSNGFAHRFSLRKNGYVGELLFDHENRKLNVMVKTDDRGLKNNSQLSGGERSFTTVCFITAMWNAVADCSPFKILDEFDVFMDMINRKLSMDYLLEFATHETVNNNKESSNENTNSSPSPSSQFIFLTPLDLNSLDINVEDRKIFRMPDPERVQTQSTLHNYFNDGADAEDDR